jgi:hypothetical protein
MSPINKATSVARQRWAEPAAKRVPGTGGRLQRAAQSGTVISVVVIGVVTLIGVLIFDQVNSAIPDDVMYNDPANESDPTQLGSARGSVVDGLGNAVELVPIVLLVLVASVVIMVVQRMRGGSGGM